MAFLPVSALADPLLGPEPTHLRRPSEGVKLARAEGRFRGVPTKLWEPAPSRRSPRFPVAVREEAASFGSDPLRELEQAYRLLVHGMELPPPRPVLWEIEPGRGELRVTVVPTLIRAFDSGAVICRSGAAEVSLRSAVLCIAEGIAARLDAAEAAVVRRAYALVAWWGFGREEERDHHLHALGEQRAAAGPFSADPSGAVLAQFFATLEQTVGSKQPPQLFTALLATGAQKTPDESATFRNEPDVLDGLHAAFEGDWARFAEGMSTQALRRILAREGMGAGMAPKPDHSFAASSLPRRLMWQSPLGPLGFSHVRIDLDEGASLTPLGFAFDSEPPFPFTYTVAKLDQQGALCGRLDTAFEPHQSHVEKNLREFSEARSLLVIGINLGLGPGKVGFDPDLGPLTAHQGLIHVFRQTAP